MSVMALKVAWHSKEEAEKQGMKLKRCSKVLLVVPLLLLVFAVAPALAIQFFYSVEEPIWTTVWSASDMLGYCGNIFGALLGALATMAAVRLTIRHEREIRAEDEEKHQARQISAWLDDMVCESEDSSTVRRRVMIRNDSSAPVYKVIITCVGMAGAGPPLEGIECGRNYPHRRCISVLPPGLWSTTISTDGNGMGVVLGVEIAFSDSAGRSWARGGEGCLKKLDAPPDNYYQLNYPIPWEDCWSAG